MNEAPSPSRGEWEPDLRAFVAVCEELLQLTVREQHELQGDAYVPETFIAPRKNLLARLNQVLIALQNRRQAWQREHGVVRAAPPALTALREALQPMIVRILQLDRENQQALLRRGLLPGRHVARAAATPGFVSQRYARHQS